MPICNSPPATVNKKSNTDISADHVTEAAKVKRTREQAYFNSYDFDAIEVLPYDEAGGDDDDVVERTRSHEAVPGLPVASSLSTQSNGSVPTTITTTSNNSSRNSSGRYAEKLAGHKGAIAGKYTYLQRLGTLFGRGNTLPATAANVNDNDVVDFNNAEQKRDNVTATSNGNFLLPRAMLKYHSVGSSSQSSSTNSMSLADISVANAAGSGSGSGIGSSSASKMKAMTSIADVNVVVGGAGAGAGSKTRLSFNASTNNGRDSQTGFLRDAEPVEVALKSKSIVTTTTASAATTTATGATSAVVLPPRQKKQSTSSSIATTTTTSTNDSGVCDERENIPEKIAIQKAKATEAVVVAAATAAAVVAVAATATAATTTTAATATTTIVASPPTKIEKQTENVQHGRASSHQSHYSTDKSGSSGYYSSNVCSTYSLDEHIYCEPVIDIIPPNINSNNNNNNIGISIGNGNNKEKISKSVGKVRPQLQLPRQDELAMAKKATTMSMPMPMSMLSTSAAIKSETHSSNSQREDMLAIGRHTRRKAGISENNANIINGDDDDNNDNDDDDDDDDGTGAGSSGHLAELRAAHYSEKLRILETSIENLDRHLKNFPGLNTQETVISYVHGAPALQQLGGLDIGEKLRAYNQLPTIMEGYDTGVEPTRHRLSWQQDIAADDSLLDIDLDSFLLVNERKQNNTRAHKANKAKLGITNPSFLTDEQVEENNYKCAKYINSCPEDAYCVESDNGLSGILDQASTSNDDNYMKRYEDQLHFQNTRELLEDVRDKIRLLTRSRNELRNDEEHHHHHNASTGAESVPKELEGMIQTLKLELEAYLQRMNQHSELEIRQLCSGLVKNQHVLKIQKAFERRRSTHTLDTIGGGIGGGVGVLDYDLNAFDALAKSAHMPPLSVQQQVTTTIRCASDPNFKMKRKSITEIFPIADYYVETMHDVGHSNNNNNIDVNAGSLPQADIQPITQLQRNLSFHKPVLTRFDGIAKKSHTVMNNARKGIEHNAGGISSVSGSGSATSGGLSGSGSGGGIGGSNGEADSINEWHRKKPSYWEMYYGTNRMHQALLGKQQRNNGMAISATQPTMSYPSSRPESDFTLDLPRAEQLRLKMEKEKKFRQRCRYITTFLSLVFFLLTVVVVSLVLTRGKRMFGSMI